ncbi:MAG TPA: TetR/AcrR family transcriptional regulator [Solirubrobacterales bacterium]|nr:TetR/AcrR family transcriptional regulator [Solirubrobacterales bacterium]
MSNASSTKAQNSAPDGVATRERIVEAASTMFNQRGFDAVPMSQVAEAAGVSTPALYWHFKSKEDLYFEVIDRTYRGFFDQLVENTVGETARERLHSYVRCFVELQLRDREATMMFGIGQLGARLSEEKQLEFAKLQRPYSDLLRGILQTGHEAGEFEIEDPTVLALVIHTMCEYSAVWFMPNRRLSATQVADIHADLVVRMAVPPPAGDRHGT